MDKFAGESHLNQPHFKNFFEQIKHLIYTPESQEYSATLAAAAVTLPKKADDTISMNKTRATLMAFVDSVIPSALGALDLRIDDYVIWILDHFISIQNNGNILNAPLSAQTARMLDVAALQLLASGNIKAFPDYFSNPDGGPFAALSPEDRFEAIRLLENLQVDLEVLPAPYQNNGGFIKNVVTTLHYLVMFGYYSEWFSLGTTRLAYPEDHRFERFPFVWQSLDYPGPSFGYRAVRGFIVDKFSE